MWDEKYPYFELCDYYDIHSAINDVFDSHREYSALPSFYRGKTIISMIVGSQGFSREAL